MAGYENGRHENFSVSELGYEIKSVQARHILIDDEAAVLGRFRIVQQFLSGGVDPDGETFDFEGKLERIPNRKVVINDGDGSTLNCQFADHS